MEEEEIKLRDGLEEKINEGARKVGDFFKSVRSIILDDVEDVNERTAVTKLLLHRFRNEIGTIMLDEDLKRRILEKQKNNEKAEREGNQGSNGEV